MAGFDRIGPYGLTRADLLAAAWLIGFRAGSRGTLFWAYLLTLVAALTIATSLFFGDYAVAAGSSAAWGYIFIAAPLLRSLKDSRDIYLSADPDGILAETPKARTLYKWATIERTFRSGSRLFVMINGRCGLVISERFTTAANIEAIVANVREHKLAADSSLT